MDLKTERGAPADWQPLFGNTGFLSRVGKRQFVPKVTTRSGEDGEEKHQEAREFQGKFLVCGCPSQKKNMCVSQSG